MKVWIVKIDDDLIGPVCRTERIAEAAAAKVKDAYADEHEVLNHVPTRVKMYWAQRYQNDRLPPSSGWIEWWDYETDDLPRSEFVAHARTEDEALGALGLTRADVADRREQEDGD